MGLFDNMGGGARYPWFEGVGDIVVRLDECKRSKKRGTTNDQTIYGFTILAKAKDAEDSLVLGKRYAWRWCEAESKYPENDKARYARMLAAFAGVRVIGGDSDAARTAMTIGDLKAAGFPVEGTFDVNTEKGRKMAAIELDEKLAALDNEPVKSEGKAWVGRIARFNLSKGGKSNYISIYAEPLPGKMHGLPVDFAADGRLTAEGVDFLQKEGWLVWDDAKPKAKE